MFINSKKKKLLLITLAITLLVTGCGNLAPSPAPAEGTPEPSQTSTPALAAPEQTAFPPGTNPRVPSVALAEVFRFAFMESVTWTQIWTNLISVLGISALLYAVVIWKVRRADR